MIDFIYAALIITNLITLGLALYFRHKLQILKARPESYELKEFMSDVLSGGGILQVTRIDPAHLLLRRPNR